MTNGISGQPPRILILDPDGGTGGSSHSLFLLASQAHRAGWHVNIWCRRARGMPERYRKLGIECSVHPNMPTVSSLPRVSRDAIDHFGFLRKVLRSRPFFRSLLDAAETHDLIHLNHENLFYVGHFLSQHSRTPVTGHVRTMVWNYPSLTVPFHARMLSKACAALIFISPNERKSFLRRARPRQHQVIRNAATIPVDPASPLRTADGRMTVLCVSNYSWYRGTDRIVDIAAALKTIAPQAKIGFRVVGDPLITGAQTLELIRIASAGGSLADYAAARGVADIVECAGFSQDVPSELARAHVLVKPTREANPWGRDIIEAMACGLPVISVGSDSSFVETDVTGFLQKEFDATTVARILLEWSCQPEVLKTMGGNAVRRVQQLCDAKTQSNKVMNCWRSVIDAAQT